MKSDATEGFVQELGAKTWVKSWPWALIASKCGEVAREYPYAPRWSARRLSIRTRTTLGWRWPPDSP